MKFHDDGRETTARQVEEVEASLEVRRIFRFVALVNGVVPDFPAIVSIYIVMRESTWKTWCP